MQSPARVLAVNAVGCMSNDAGGVTNARGLFLYPFSFIPFPLSLFLYPAKLSYSGSAAWSREIRRRDARALSDVSDR